MAALGKDFCARSAAGGDIVVAYVLLAAAASVTSGEFMSYCRDGLALFKVPAHVNKIDELALTTGTNGTKIRMARRRAEEQLAVKGCR